MLPWRQRRPKVESLPINVADANGELATTESANSKSRNRRKTLPWRQRKPKLSLPISVADIKEKADPPAAELLSLRPPIDIPREFTVTEYLRQAAPGFRYLDDLRRMGWENPEGDEYFKKLQSAADNAGASEQKRFFRMMRSLGKEMDDATSAFCCPHPHTLDLCMAPGGYSASVLDRHPDATIRGVSLPRSLGGHNLRVSHGRRDPRVQVQFMDITMLANEFGVRLNDIPSRHPDASRFTSYRPYYGQEFDIVICDGQVLRTHPRGEWREYCEATRLLMSQLILGLQRIKTGGTFVMLLHKIEAWNTCTLLKTFNGFSSMTLFKPEKKHAQRSSFYLVAKNVQPQSGPAKEAVKEWKKAWYTATFGGDGGHGSVQEDPREEVVAKFLEEFSSRLVELGETIWGVQTRALEMAPYVRQGDSGRNADVDKVSSDIAAVLGTSISVPTGPGN